MKKLAVVKITMLFLLLLCICSLLYIFFRAKYFQDTQEVLIENIEKTIENNIEKEKNILKDGEIGILIIPSIGVKAPICEGISSNVLKFSIGHFEETNLWNGNVALASHNRGSYAHYFSRINELKNGEEIIYITNMGERRYKVTESKIIKETNVEILKDTKENIITLITCVTGKRDKRLCVIGKEIY